MTGIKHDQGKLRWSLFPWDALQAIGGVLEYGAQKYGPSNWEKVPEARERYFNAALRHLVAWHRGEDIDESGHHHLAHASACVIFLLAFALREKAKASEEFLRAHRNRWPLG